MEGMVDGRMVREPLGLSPKSRYRSVVLIGVNGILCVGVDGRERKMDLLWFKRNPD